MSDFFEFREKLTRRAKSDPAPATSAPAQPLTVSQLSRMIDQALRAKLPPRMLVKGEISNFHPHAPSGHLYFTLKDATTCIDCVMYRSEAERLRFDPQDGMELLADGSVRLYAQRGKYQLCVTTLQPLGKGALDIAFQQLRRKLDAEGLFAAARKKPIPAFPLRIALVTAPHGAALQDMLKVLRRFPWLHLMLYPVPVQGGGAAERIADALRDLSKCHADVGGID